MFTSLSTVRVIKYLVVLVTVWYIIGLIVRHYTYTRLTRQLSQSPSKDLYILPNFFPAQIFTRLVDLVEAHQNQPRGTGFRTNSIIRNGSSVSHHQASRLATGNLLSQIFSQMDSAQTIQQIYHKTGLRLQFVPVTDPNRVSMIFYTQPKDGIDWHYDGNNYYGHRWAAIYTIVNSGSGSAKFSSAKFMYRDKTQTHGIDSQPNSLILFRGDRIQHKVDTIREGERRIVVSMLFCDICERTLNPLSHLYQSGVNFIFYGTL